MSFQLLQLKAYPIYEQLLLEERLLRTSEQNFCLINEGSSPAIVLGISGKKEELVNEERALQNKIPLIKRFSGGGTVIVDEQTLFITFICQKESHPFAAYPEPIMKWTEELYKEAFQHSGFALRENDYVLHDKNCGGNAQYIKKHRWLHHTSFLWDYSEENMQHLLHPRKTPSYREGRAHGDFLCRLKESFASKEEFIAAFLNALHKRFTLKRCSLESVLKELPPAARVSTHFL